MKVTVIFVIIEFYSHCMVSILIDSPNKPCQIQTWISISITFVCQF